MDVTSDTSSVGQEPDFGSPAEIISRTLILKCPSKGRAIFRLDFKDHLDKLISVEEVAAFGSSGPNDTWHLTLTPSGG